MRAPSAPVARCFRLDRIIARFASTFSLIATLLVVSAITPAVAAPQAQLSIEVIDAENKPVADARLELRLIFSKDSVPLPESVVRLVCDNDGRCIANNLAPGNYVISVTYAALVARLQQPVVLAPGRQNIVIRVLGLTAAEVTSLGVVRIAPTGALSTASAPSVELNPQTLARSGALNLVDSFAALPGITVNRPNGGSAALPASLIIRGGDPKETVVQVDGNPVNNSQSGDFDLSVLDPTAFQTVQIVYGLAPASLVGANTEGGTVNFQTLQPTVAPQGLLGYSFGSFTTNSYTFESTGTATKFGYAFDARSFNQRGEVSSFPVTNAATGQQQILGSGISGSNGLAKLTYNLPHDGLVQASVLTFGYNEDLSAALSTPLDPRDATPSAPFISYAGSERSSVNTFYSGSVRLPIGRLSDEGNSPALITTSYMFAHSRQNVNGPAAGLSEYLLDTTDTLRDYSLEYDRLLPDAQLTIVARAQGETLQVPDVFGARAPTQSQTNHAIVTSYAWSGGSRLEYTAVGYLSSFSTFGSSLNPRAAVVWRPQWQTVVRASAGTGFQAPLLSEKVVPSPLPPPTANGLIEIGNPNLTADHTLEFELDASHTFGSGPPAPNAEIDLYHVNQDDDDVQFIPVGASPQNPKFSYPVNIAKSIWQGFALIVRTPLGRVFSAEGSYNVNAAYPLSSPAALRGSAGNLVPQEQFQGIPVHRAALSLQGQTHRLSWLVGTSYESINNDLNQPSFATVQANLRYEFGHTSITLNGTNLTGVYDERFTRVNVGTSYAGLTGPILSDAYQLQGPALTATLAQRW